MRCYLLARAQNRTTRPLSEVTNCTRSVSAARRSVIRPRVYSSSGQLECRGYVVKLADALTPDFPRVDWNAIYQARRAKDAHAVTRQTLLGVFVREPAAHVVCSTPNVGQEVRRTDPDDGASCPAVGDAEMSRPDVTRCCQPAT